MTHDRKPPRQPLFWAALAFSLGLWMGVRAWRPPSWWVIAVVAFVFAASWFLSKRAWLAKALSLGAWILLGAFLIQVRGQRTDKLQQNDARILALAYGREVTLTARVIREGYARRLRGCGRFANPLMWRRKRSRARAKAGLCGLGCG